MSMRKKMECNEVDCQKQFVSWKIFIWVVGIFTVTMTILFNMTMGAVNSNAEIKTQLSQIQTDLTWIKISLEK